MSIIFLAQGGKYIHPSERLTANIIKATIRKANKMIDNRISKKDNMS